MEDRRFYFIKNEFIEKYGMKYKLMQNKENGIKRPCYFCFKDKIEKEIIWFVPISKQYEKYKNIYEKKKEKIHREPLNFSFGIVKDEKAVFLIQNMFPTLEKYIEGKYQIRNNDVTISAPLQKEIIKKAEDIIRLENRGIRIAFADLVEFQKELLNEQ